MSVYSYDEIYKINAWRENNIRLVLIQGEGLSDNVSDYSNTYVKTAKFQLCDENGVIQIPSNTAVKLALQKQDGTEALIEMFTSYTTSSTVLSNDKDNGIATFAIKRSMTDVVGNMKGEIRLHTSTGIIKFYGVKFYVYDGISDNAAEQSEAFSDLVAQTSKVEALLEHADSFGNLTSLDNIIAHGGTHPVTSGVIYDYLNGNFVKYSSISSSTLNNTSTHLDTQTIYRYGSQGLIIAANSSSQETQYYFAQDGVLRYRYRIKSGNTWGDWVDGNNFYSIINQETLEKNLFPYISPQNKLDKYFVKTCIDKSKVKLDKYTQILGFGDSIMATSDGGSWLDILQEKVGCPAPYNYAIGNAHFSNNSYNGTRLITKLNAFFTDVDNQTKDASKINLIIVAGGTNDAKNGTPINTFKTDVNAFFTSLVSGFESRNIECPPVLVITPIRRGTEEEINEVSDDNLEIKIAKYGAILNNQALQFGFSVLNGFDVPVLVDDMTIDVGSNSATITSFMLNDGLHVHPNSTTGRATYAQAVIDAIGFKPKATTLAGYGINDAYTKTEVDAVVRNQNNALTNTNGNYIYSNDIVTNASDKFGTVKTQNAPIASFGNYTNGLAVGNVGEKVTRGTQVYWYRYEIDAKSFTNYKIKYYGVNNPNVSDYIIVVDKNDIILAKHGESQSAARYATKTFTTPANTCKIIVNSGSGTATLQGMYTTPIDLQKQVNNTSVTMDGKISIPNSELTPSDSGTGFLTDDGFGNVYVNTNANWNWKKFAVISGVYFVSTVKAANASLTYDYVYVTDSSGLIKSSYIHPSSGGGLVSDEKIEVLENGYVYVQTFAAAQTSKMKCKDSTYIFDELLRKNNEFESYEKNVFGGYALPTFSSSENNLTVKVPNKGVFVCEQGSSNNAFKYITPTQNTFSLNNLQLLVLNKSTNDIEIIYQSTFLNNLGSYIVLVWNYYGQVRGQWYLYYIAQQLNSGYHTMMQEVTNKYISRQGKFYADGIHENTVDAIKYAKSKGYNHIRVSVCFTSDGYGVLSHFNKLADLQGAERKDGEPISTETISGMTITELDADYEYYGESFARLDDAVALCKQINMELTLEIKSSFNGSQQKSIDVLRAYGMNKHTFWSCSSISQINSIVSIDNKANVAYIVHLSSISDVDSLYAVNTTGEKRLDIYNNDTYDATIWAYARSKDITIKYGSVYNINTAVAMAPYCDYLECADIEYPALAIYQKTS